MVNVLPVLVIFLHTLAAWFALEAWFNIFHHLPRPWFVFWHYAMVFGVFALVFGIYFKFFHHYPAFATTMIAMVWVFVIEFVVFKYIYSGELWFLNYVDWIVPAFIAASAIYFAGSVVK